jgi:hypothetical protein
MALVFGARGQRVGQVFACYGAHCSSSDIVLLHLAVVSAIFEPFEKQSDTPRSIHPPTAYLASSTTSLHPEVLDRLQSYRLDHMIRDVSLGLLLPD